MTDHRWRVGLVGAISLVGFGLLFANRTLITASIIPLAYVLYGTLSRVPREATLSVTRMFDPVGPEPGEQVTVRLTVQNETDRTLPDVRLIDTVPEELAVTEGSPRTARSLSPGEEVTLQYTVVAKRGNYQFPDPVVRLRPLSGADQVTRELTASGDTTLACANAVRDPPLDEAAIPRAGTLPTDSGGSGLEFYATRQYRPGDPMNRIDWRNFAKTGEFVTIQYREEQAARTVIIVDARAVGRVTPAAGYPTGTALCAYAGERIYDALDSAGVVTSVTAVGLESGSLGGLIGPDGLPWVDPDMESGRSVSPSTIFQGVQQAAQEDATPVSVRSPQTTTGRARADGGVAAQSRQHQILDVEGKRTDTDAIDHLLARLPPNAQVLVCTPLLDNWPVSLAQSLTTRGYPFVVVSPDVLRDGTTGQRVARIHRRLRLHALERMGETVSWDPQQPIDYALRLSLPYLLEQT